jgi:hypothetical protein
MQSRYRTCAALVAAFVAASVLPAAAASAGRLQIRQIGTSSYPTIRVLLVAPSTGAPAPRLLISHPSASGVTAQNLAGQESIALVIDDSQSMRGGALTYATRAARTLIATSPSADQISLLTVGSTTTTLAGFSAAGVDALPILGQLPADPTRGVALWDSLLQAVHSLKNRPLAGRVIVLVTAGVNTNHSRTFRDAIRAARSAHVAIYTVGIPSQLLVDGRWQTLGHRWYTPRQLEQVATATGGRYYGAPSPAALPSIYRAIGAELARTWEVDFATAARPGERLSFELASGDARAIGTTILSSRLANKGRGGVSLVLLFALVLAAALTVVLLVALRSALLNHGWRRQPPELY